MSSDSRAPMPVRFRLHADPSPCLLPRLLQPFARRDLTPDHVRSHRTGDRMEVEIVLHAMPADTVHLVLGNLTQIVGVRQVTATEATPFSQAA
jgi:hypothetical protein